MNREQPPFELPEQLKVLPGKERRHELIHQRLQLVVRLGLSTVAGGIAFARSNNPLEATSLAGGVYVGVDGFQHLVDSRVVRWKSHGDKLQQTVIDGTEDRINREIGWAYMDGKSDVLLAEIEKLVEPRLDQPS